MLWRWRVSYRQTAAMPPGHNDSVKENPSGDAPIGIAKVQLLKALTNGITSFDSMWSAEGLSEIASTHWIKSRKIDQILISPVIGQTIENSNDHE